MKTIIRATVLVLTLTGAAATTQPTPASNQAATKVARMSAMPKPMCPPDNPGPCF